MRKGDLGASVAALQRHLKAQGIPVDPTAIYDESTERAVMEFQRRHGLVIDGFAGKKTLSVLMSGERDNKTLAEADLVAAAERLDVPLAAIKAVLEVESRGHGFLDDGRPVILYERHVAYKALKEAGIDADALAARFPNIINPTRGGYAGKESEWARLYSARQAITSVDATLWDIAGESCSWGQFQIMGYHWRTLGYASFAEFHDAMHRSEADQLDAFVRFIEADPVLHKALKGKKWGEFARLYNGPAYKENLYDVKLARAFEAHTAEVAA